MKDNSRLVRGLVINTLTALIVVSLCVYLIWSLRILILPVSLGILLAYLFKPLKTAFRYRWLPESMRVTLIISMLTGGLLLGIKFVESSIPSEKENLELLVRLKFKFNEKFNRMMSIDPKTGQGNSFYNLIADDVNPLKQSLNDHLELSPAERELFHNYRNGVAGIEPISDVYYHYFLENNKTTQVGPKAAENSELPHQDTKSGFEKKSFLIYLLGTLSVWFLMPIIFVFFLLDDGSMNQFFIKLIPNRYFELALTIFEEVDDAIGMYLRGISLECLLVGLSMVVGFYLIGIPLKMSLVIGILSGIATVIPFLGPVVGLGSGLIFVIIAEDLQPILPMINSDNAAIAVIVVNIVVHLLDNTVFQPIVLGGAVNLHPLVIIVGLFAGSMLFGAAGVVLAIPALVILKAVVQFTFRGLKEYRII